MKLTLDIKEAHVVQKKTLIGSDVIGNYTAPPGSVVVTLSDGITRFAFHKDHFFDLFPEFDLDHDPESERLEGLPTDATPLMTEPKAKPVEKPHPVKPKPHPVSDMDRAADNGFRTDDSPPVSKPSTHKGK